MTSEEEQRQAILALGKSFAQCTDFDLWGQPIEAMDGYKRLSKQLDDFANAEFPLFSDEQKKVLRKIGICLDLRCKALQAPGTVNGILLDDLKRIGNTLDSILKQRCRDFPVDVTAAQLQARTLPSSQNRVQESDEVDDEKQGSRAKGSLLPRPLAYSGMKVLTVKIERIGLKDATQYIEPYITVSVRDATGTELTASQDTPVATKKENKSIVFNEEVHIQKSIESLPNGFSIFFEFKHFKPKKNMISTKCWAFMEKDEVKEGPVALELYQKPADYKRKNIKLLTVKPLYLHLKIIFNT
ncbi:axin interactor, dorsalization-associated protein B-like [Saccostrea echinata]|uniref:axin interactor, dorsalization-associated protein B-like n=1 Tax=Saccostrea echinata TaxID=191078 RepID=UPI002A82290C|nr:axin interactor, dorsalization-associated protein B-like [Saccostrea echinata]